MGVPKKHTTKGRRNKRRLHIFLRKPVLTSCPKCKKPVLPHTVCSNCGYYKGRVVLDVFKKLTKKERKIKEREIAAKEKEEKTEKILTFEELSRK